MAFTSERKLIMYDRQKCHLSNVIKIEFHAIMLAVCSVSVSNVSSEIHLFGAKKNKLKKIKINRIKIE